MTAKRSPPNPETPTTGKREWARLTTGERIAAIGIALSLVTSLANTTYLVATRSRSRPQAEFVDQVGYSEFFGCARQDGGFTITYDLLEYYLVQNKGTAPVALLGVSIGTPDLPADLPDDQVQLYTRGEYFGEADTLARFIEDEGSTYDIFYPLNTWELRRPPFLIEPGEPVNLLLQRHVVLLIDPPLRLQNALARIYSHQYTDTVVFSFSDGSESALELDLAHLWYIHGSTTHILGLEPSELQLCP